MRPPNLFLTILCAEEKPLSNNDNNAPNNFTCLVFQENHWVRYNIIHQLELKISTLKYNFDIFSGLKKVKTYKIFQIKSLK